MSTNFTAKKTTDTKTPQKQVAKELKQLIKKYLERATEITDDCFVSPEVVTVTKDKLIKIPLDSPDLNEVTIKKRHKCRT